MYANEDSEVLMLGSLPSVKSLEYGFYYSHPKNRFFPVLAAIFTEPTPLTIEERKDFLKHHQIALYDVIEECEIKGSSDASIRKAETIKINTILAKYQNIKCITVNGGTAIKLFKKHVLKDVDVDKIKVIYLPSTSPLNWRYTLDMLVNRYKEAFND